MNTTTDYPYTIVIQDEGSFTHTVYTHEATESGARMAVEDLVAAMEGVKVEEIDTWAEGVDIDIDGEIVFAAWYTVPGSDLQSLVAIVFD